MTAFTSAEGYEIKMKESHFGKIEDKSEAHEWLKKSGNGDIIEREIKVTINYDEDDNACALLKELESRGLNPELKEAVNPQTLNKFVRECVEENIELPESIKRITINEAKIKNVV